MERGQIVQLGPHRLMCGDAFNPLDVDLLIESTKIDLLYCDPPYGISLHKQTRFQGLKPDLSELLQGYERGNRRALAIWTLHMSSYNV